MQKVRRLVYPERSNPLGAASIYVAQLPQCLKRTICGGLMEDSGWIEKNGAAFGEQSQHFVLVLE